MMKNFFKYQMTESMWFSSATYAAYHLHSVRWKWSLSYWLWSSPLLVPHLKYGLRFTIMLSSGQWCDIQNFICLMAGCYWSYTRELKQFHWWTRLICCGYISLLNFSVDFNSHFAKHPTNDKNIYCFSLYFSH